MASASPAIGGLRRKCWLGALAGAVGPGVVAKSLLGIDIDTSRREVIPPRSLLCRRMFAFSMENHSMSKGNLEGGKHNAGHELLSYDLTESQLPINRA